MACRDPISNYPYARWNEYMKDVMTMALDPETGAQLKMMEVFYLE
jgi:L-rhamnose mutarotase